MSDRINNSVKKNINTIIKKTRFIKNIIFIKKEIKKIFRIHNFAVLRKILIVQVIAQKKKKLTMSQMKINKMSGLKKKRFFIIEKKKFNQCLRVIFRQKKKKLLNVSFDSKYYSVYIQHFLNMFLKQGKKSYTESVYKNLLILHKQTNMQFILNIFKVIKYLQFFLLLKGYRYKVGRGVLKIRYFLMPITIYRQFFLSFFYFYLGIKKRVDISYCNKIFLEFFHLLYLRENNALTIITNLYTLAQQSRMFIPKKKRIFFQRKKVKKVRLRLQPGQISKL